MLSQAMAAPAGHEHPQSQDVDVPVSVGCAGGAREVAVKGPAGSAEWFEVHREDAARGIGVEV